MMKDESLVKIASLLRSIDCNDLRTSEHSELQEKRY